MPPRGAKRRRAAEEGEGDDGSQGYEDEVPRNTQRRGRRITQPGNGDSDEEQEAATQGDGDGDTLQTLIRKLVRYALACEYSRQKIRREGIREKVIGLHGRGASFKNVFEGAQKELRVKFGMRMEELPSLEKVTMHEKRAAAQKNQSGGSAASSNSWSLISVLPAEYRHPAIVPPSKAPTEWHEATYVGLYTMVISLISLAGGTLTEAKLERYLHRLNADMNTSLDTTAKTLARMSKDGYIVKYKEANTAGQEESTEWRVGPRGKIEVGNGGVKGLVMHVYGENVPKDLANRLHSSLGLELVREAGENRDEDEGRVNAVEPDEPAPRRRGGRRSS